MGDWLTRTASRTEVPEYHNSLLTLLDFVLLHRLDKSVLGIERPCFPSKLKPLFPSYFSDGTARG